ncbi:MAG TPA: PorV/PorQ family protein, partial [Calditrichia bacterium]|nr:PorV/PorQ family protein [Calditrichia bacterium]
EATIMHVQWLPQFNLGDLYYDFFAARYHLDGIGTLGFSIQYLNYGENVQTDNEGNILGTFTSNEIAVTGSYGMRLMDNLGLGANLKFIYSRLSPVEVDAQKGEGVGSTFALDLGVLYLPGWSSRLNLGANLSNLGPKITYIDRDQADPIPTNLRLGAAYKLVDSEFNRLTAVYDINRLLVPQDAEKRQDSFLTYLYSGWGGDNFVDRFTHSVGLEYWYTDLIALRSGYFFESDKAGGRQFWTFGGGLNVSVIGIDFSYILGGSEDSPLNDTIRFSLSARF